MIGGGSLRKRLQDCPDCARLPVEHPLERVVRDQPSGIRPVARRDQVPYRIDDLPLVGEPPRGPAVQVRNLLGGRPAKFQAQEVRQELVVPEPGALTVERDDERVGVLQRQQHLLGA